MKKSSSVVCAELVAYPMEAWHPSIIGCAMAHGAWGITWVCHGA